jgi:DNA integrity scanning protein DisA with diadenylate cyclase activity
MTAVTDSIGITVSQSGGIVRVFKKGEVIMTIEPQRRIVFREELK